MYVYEKQDNITYMKFLLGKMHKYVRMCKIIKLGIIFVISNEDYSTYVILNLVFIILVNYQLRN